MNNNEFNIQPFNWNDLNDEDKKRLFKEAQTIERKRYYEQNKKKILTKEACPVCGLLVSKYYMDKHQKRPLCQKRNDRKIKKLIDEFFRTNYAFSIAIGQPIDAPKLD